MDYRTLIEQSEHNAAIQREEYNLFALLKPTLVKQGNKWICFLGDNIMDTIKGLGDSPYLAILNWNSAMVKTIEIPKCKNCRKEVDNVQEFCNDSCKREYDDLPF